MTQSLAHLSQKNASIKKRFLRMYRSANAGHVGASLSCAEVMAVAFQNWMKPQDEFVLSKGHAAAALYSCLAERGDISEEACSSFYQDGTLLAGHPPPNKIKGISFATGSLGHGLSLSAGLAKANQLLKKDARVFCLCSDGELDEGSSWEAALFAAHHELTGLICLVDRNGLQGFGRTEDVFRLEPLADKFLSFGWRVLEVEGHDLSALVEIESQFGAKDRKPLAVICKTTKGRGLEGLENTVDCHYLPMMEKDYVRLLQRIDSEVIA